MIGTSPRRKEDGRLLVGEGRFLDDVRRPGLVHLGVVRSLHAHARLLKVATAEALGAPGVLAAFAAGDLPELARPIPSPYGRERHSRPFDRPVLARETVRDVGEPVAAVVADDPYRLADALDLVTVEYEVKPPVPSAEAAAAGTTRVHDQWPDNVAVVARGTVGDVERALAEAEVVVHERLRHPRLTGIPIETRGALAYRDEETGGLVLWSSTQNLSSCTYFYPETVTWAFGVQAAAVEVDVESCRTRLLAYVAVHDAGRPINPEIVEGQLQGGATQGIGAGLGEELVYDDHGQLVTGSLMDYAVPRADELPPIDVLQLAHPSAVNELGIKGVGESGAIAGAAAIANAIEGARADLGVTIREVPVTPPLLFALLEAARRT